MYRHINIPIFIPHEGCNNACVFCDQKSITGTALSAHRDITEEIDAALTTIDKTDFVEIAFFGGSFTGIDLSLMTHLCDTAYSYVKSGKVNSIRLSTRPDYINENILLILKQRGVTDIELGIQSMSQNVLDASRRGHTTLQTINACSLIKSYGFNLVGQMMIGLPQSSLDDEIYTARSIIDMGADAARIYPTVVFKETELCSMTQSGIYTPISIDEAVNRSAAVYKILRDAGIQVLRIGLHSSEQLSDQNKVYAGANHPALGELVMGEYFFEKLTDKLDVMKNLLSDINSSSVLCIYCHTSAVSKIAGQNGRNKERLLNLLKESCINIKDIKIISNSVYPKEKITVSAQNIKAQKQYGGR